jgi:hypothetical protein
MEGNRISRHGSVCRLYDGLKKDGMNTIWDRFDAQDELFRSYNKYLFICPTNRI